MPITLKTRASNDVAMLKWLATPRHACMAMSASSIGSATQMPVPSQNARPRRVRCRSRSGPCPRYQANVNE